MRRSRSVLLTAFALALAGCGGNTPSGGGAIEGLPAEAVELSGRGATFVEPVMKFWTTEFRDQTNGRVTVSYTGSGSGNGVSSMTDRLADFGCSDAPMNRKQLDLAVSRGGPVVHVPLVIGAVVPMYNLPGVEKPIAFSGPVIADVFMGKITRWNDPKLAALNPGVNLPDLGIQPVARSDASGTSFIFSDYLAKVSPEFRASVGASNEPHWPERVGVKQPGNNGVANHVTNNAGAIGYVELTYALDTKAQFGAVVNKAGKPVRADLPSITRAAEATLDVPQTAEPYSLHDLTYSLTDAPGDESYPIAGMSFALLYQKQTGPKGKGVVAFLKWVVSPEAQKIAEKRNYAPLPEPLQKKILEKLEAVSVEP
jgi:phosphate transport system substrate-binding protein